MFVVRLQQELASIRAMKWQVNVLMNVFRTDCQAFNSPISSSTRRLCSLMGQFTQTWQFCHHFLIFSFFRGTQKEIFCRMLMLLFPIQCKHSDLGVSFYIYIRQMLLSKSNLHWIQGTVALYEIDITHISCKLFSAILASIYWRIIKQKPVVFSVI